MDNKTRNIILLGIAGVAIYLFLKSKKASASNSVTSNSTEPPQSTPKVTGGYPCPDGTIDYFYKPDGFMSPCVGHQPIKLQDPIVATTPNRTTKDCQVTYYSCTSGSRSEIIEIPLDANCNDYQEVRPNCVNELFASDKIYTPQAKIDKGYL